MRIDHLTVLNFKGFDLRRFSFNTSFNLLVGINGTGKTSALDALAVAAGTWFLGIRGYESPRHIKPDEIRLAARVYEDEIRFEEQYPVRVEASGQVFGNDLNWARALDNATGRTKYGEATTVRDLARKADTEAREGKAITLPLISYYGTGRLWLEPRSFSRIKTAEKLSPKTRLSRLEGYRNSIDPRLSVKDLVQWIARQSWAGYQQGKEKTLFQAVKQAIIACTEDAENLYFDPARGEVIVVMREHGAQPFANLSDGQRSMLAMVGDIAQKAAKLNPHLGDQVLTQTPGVVLIDELDLHLHPRWQRRVMADLKKCFPNIQFIATTHSPQLIGQARTEEIIVLESGMKRDGHVQRRVDDHPEQSFGMDSNWILKYIMGTSDRDPQVTQKLDEIRNLIEEDKLESAREKINSLRLEIGEHPELVRDETLIERYSRARK
jgi:predicted ATP-binding protein involved in virulence